MKPAADFVHSNTLSKATVVAPLADNAETCPLSLDPIRRFIPTSYCATVPLMGRTIRLETNDTKILQHVAELFARYPGTSDGHPRFLWRIVVDSDTRLSPPWPQRTAFSDAGLRFVAFGQRNFLAVDLDARQAIGILSQGLMEDELGLTSPFLDNMFCLTAGSLGLVPVWANCLASQQNAVLLFGGPGNGKTCTSYMAEKLGLDFHADEGVFLEADSSVVHCWAGFWPAAFRPEALQFYPELKESSRPYLYRNVTVYHRTKQLLRSAAGLPVKPVCCLFLERRASASPKLVRIPPSDLGPLLAQYVLFKDEDRFAEQQNTVLQSLAALPAHVLRYSDPAIAAKAARDLLVASVAVECDGGGNGVSREAVRGSPRTGAQ